MTLSELDTPRLACGRTADHRAHEWVGGRCPGRTASAAVDVATHAATVRQAIDRTSTTSTRRHP